MVKDHDIIQAVKDRNIPALHKLLSKAGKSNKKLIGGSKRLNINYQDGDGMSALHQASLMGNLEMMQMLLECHADVSIHDNKGMLALHYAAWQGMSDPVHTLLQWKSPVNEVSQDGNTPLHLACQHGHFDVVNLLLLHNSSPTLQNKDRKTPMDLACEFGRYRVVDLLLRSNLCAPLLMDSPEDMMDENSTTPLHLAAKNGHIEIIRLLLQAGVNINRSTLKGTSLHEAALCGKIEVVRLLLDCGIDVNKANSYDQTALDIVNSYTTSRAAKDLKHLLKEASFAVQARAIKNYSNIYDPSTLAFKEGDIIKVLEQREGAWKGVVISDGRMAKPGYFPPDTVVLLDSSAHFSNHIIEGKRVHMPSVPDLLNRSPGYHQTGVGSPFSPGAHAPPSPGYLNSPVGCPQTSLGMDHSFPPPPAMFSPSSPFRKDWDGGNSFSFPHHQTYRLYNTSSENLNGRIVNQNGEQIGEWSSSLPAFAGDIRNAGHGKGSPTNSNRNSGASSDSGRGYSTGHLDHANANVKPPQNFGNVQVNNNHRLSSQSYESGVSSRQSYHSTSSSSVGSLDRLEESGQMSTINVAALFQAGMPDHEVMRVWLRDLRFEEYCILFVQAGYDMPTISHMTPQDLSAIGITKPGHRKRLKAEIARLNIHDGIPDFKPVDMMEWLHMLGLEQYYNTLSQQGYDDLDKVTDITWEDLEEIGIQKLGHQKKIILAIERLKRINSNSKRLSSMDKSGHSEIIDPPPPLGHARWSGDDYPSSPFKTKKSLSGDNLNSDRYSQKSDRFSQHSDSSLEFVSHSPSTGYQPDVVAIQVKRHASNSESPKEMSGVRISSFQAAPSSVREDRDSTPTAEEEMTQYPAPIVAPSVPKAVIKPKPVAKIIAKTKRSSKETSPEIIDIEKYEAEKNYEFGKSPGKAFLINSAMLKKTGQSDHIYDQPRTQNAPMSPKSPTTSMSHPFPAPPTGPVFVAVSNQNGSPQPQNSPNNRKVPPPPPPKRTNSVSSRQDTNSSRYAGSIPKSAFQTTDQNAQRTTTMSPRNPSQPTPRRGSVGEERNEQKQLAFASCVQSLSAKFGSKRMETSSEDVSSSDGEDFPPPPPPIAMDIITPKIHNYGIPSKDEKTPAELRGMGKLGQSSTNGNSSTSNINNSTEKPNSFTYKAPVLKPVTENSPSPQVPALPNVTHNPPVLNHVTTTAQSKPQVQNSPRVQHISHELKRKDSTSSSDSIVSASSVDSNTLPFANENVGTIKQRAPTTKPSIVPINESTDSVAQGNGQGFPSHQRVLPTLPQKAGIPSHLKELGKGPRPSVPMKPNASPPVPAKPKKKKRMMKMFSMTLTTCYRV